MTLTNLTEEEKRERKLKQKAEAQKRYYEKHKDYYKEKASSETKRIRRNYKNAITLINLMKTDDNLNGSILKVIDDILDVLIEK